MQSGTSKPLGDNKTICLGNGTLINFSGQIKQSLCLVFALINLHDAINAQ